MRRTIVAALILTSLISACSSTDEKQLEPSPLPEFTEKASLHEEWSRSVGNGQGAFYNRLTPAIEGKYIYASDISGEVMAMDRFSGEKLWETDLKHPVSGAISVHDTLVFVGTLKGEVIALDSKAGKLIWSASVGSEVLAPPVSNGDELIVQTQDDRIIALDADTGSRLWASENTPALLTLRGSSTPLVTTSLVFAALSTGKVVALDTRTGAPLWEQKIALPKGRSELERMIDIDGMMRLDNGILYVVTYQGRVAAIDVARGQMLWQREASSYAGLSDDDSTLFISLSSGAVEGIDKNTSSALWTNDQLLRRDLSAPAVLGAYLAVGDAEGYVHLLSTLDGAYSGREEVDSSGIRAPLLALDNWLYVYANDGTLVAYTLK